MSSVFDELQQASQHLSEAVQQLQAVTCGIENVLDKGAELHPNAEQAFAAVNILRSFCSNQPGPTGCNDCPFAESNGNGGSTCSLECTPDEYPKIFIRRD